MTSNTVTDRLILKPIDPTDGDMLRALFAIQSDPDTWKHLPEGVERDISQTRAFAEGYARSWREEGLGWWAATLREPLAGIAAGTIVGLGGAGIRMPEIRAWNLGYRLIPAVWGKGLASELSGAAVQAANAAQPETPVVARVLERNPASCRVLERVGLGLEWKGPVPEGTPLTAGLILRVYSDRSLDEQLLQQIVALG